MRSLLLHLGSQAFELLVSELMVITTMTTILIFVMTIVVLLSVSKLEFIVISIVVLLFLLVL